MMALAGGARHVTAVDRWLYMALACKESLVRLQQSPPYEQCRILTVACYSQQMMCCHDVATIFCCAFYGL